MPPAAEIIELDSMLEAAGAALAAGVGITASFAIAVLGVVRASDSFRHERTLIGSLWGALGLVALLAAIAGVVAGLVIVASR